MFPTTTGFIPSAIIGATVLLCSTLPASALYLGPPAVYESAAEQKENLARSKSKLQKLQQAATHCADVRMSIVHSSYARLPVPVEMPLSDYDKKQLRHLISRMRAVKDSNASLQQPEYIARLELLSASGKVMGSVDCHEVTTDSLVNSQGYAAGARLSLSAADASIWYAAIRPDEARAIARQPNPARIPRGRGIPRRPAPPPPAPEPSFDNDFPRQEYHRDCNHKHGKHHKHKSKDHWCDSHH